MPRRNRRCRRRITSYNVCYTKLLRDVIYYAGDCNAGSKTIAINLPNDEEVQLAKGSRRLQLKNAMQAKFDKILLPIADQLIAPDQRPHVTFDAFFGNVMFHEVAHGLGIKNTINGNGTVREALKEQYVITSYSIHYTKLYDPGAHSVSRFQTREKPSVSDPK